MVALVDGTRVAALGVRALGFTGGTDRRFGAVVAPATLIKARRFPWGLLRPNHAPRFPSPAHAIEQDVPMVQAA